MIQAEAQSPVAEWFRECALAARFRRDGEPFDVAQGTLLEEAVSDRHVLFVKSGWLMRSHVFENGRQSSTGLYLPNDVLNFEVLIGSSALGEVAALNDASLLRLPASSIAKSLYEDAEMARSLFWRQAADALWLREALQAVGQLNVEDRLVFFVWQTRQRLIDYGGLDPGAHTFDLPLTQGHLGSIIGSTIIHTNRVVRQLREKNLVIIRAQCVNIPDLAAFERHGAQLAA